MPAALRPYVGAVRPYVTAGVALVGASVIAVTPIQPPPVPDRMVSQEYSLTAASTSVCTPGYAAELCDDLSSANSGPGGGLTTNAILGSGSSLLYIPVNLLNMFLSIPAWEVQAMNRLADAMIATGSWQVWSPTNVFGFDEQDPPKLTAFIDMLIPFKPFSSVLGDQLSWWARANLPMNTGCAALPGACPDRKALLDSMFKVPMSELYEGYQFPTVTNPITGEETSWSGDYVKLEPWGPFASTWEWLTAPPTGVETVSLRDVFDTTVKLGKALFEAFYPFVQNSEWYNADQTGLAPLFRALAPILCPSCDPANPYDNPWLYENYPPNQESGAEAMDTSTFSLFAAAPEDIAANRHASPAQVDTQDLTVGEENSETSNPVTTAVTGLTKKFDFAETTEEPAAESVTESSDGVAETVTDAVSEAGEPEEAGGASTETDASDTPDTNDADTSSEDSEESQQSGAPRKHHRSDTDGGSTESKKADSGSSDESGGGSDE